MRPSFVITAAAHYLSREIDDGLPLPADRLCLAKWADYPQPFYRELVRARARRNLDEHELLTAVRIRTFMPRYDFPRLGSSGSVTLESPGPEPSSFPNEPLTEDFVSLVI
jgi:hypothetical protein